MSSALFVVLVLLGLIILGFPISFSLGITGLALLYKLDMTFMLEILPQRMFSGVNSFVIMAMPFFMLAGSIMNRTGITNALVRFAESCIGWVRGGLAHVNIVGSILFAGLTGSAVADTAALGSVLIPAMKKAGYSRGFSAAVTAASSVIGPIIPPSIIMVIYGSLMNVSIAGLFVAGIFPGLLFGVTLMGVTYVIARKRDYPKQEDFSVNELGYNFVRSLPALMMPVIILGGILGGIFTPTEAAGVAVLYAIFIGFIFRRLSFKDLWKSLEETVLSMGMILLILSCAGILSWLMASEKIPDQIAQAILSITENKYLLLFLINVVLLVVGMFMDITAALIMLASIMAPLAIHAGVDPLHFGIIMVTNLNIGLITPPLGACLFVASGIARIQLKPIVREILPFVLAEVAVLFVVTYFEGMVLFLPRLLGYV